MHKNANKKSTEYQQQHLNMYIVFELNEPIDLVDTLKAAHNDYGDAAAANN